MGTTQQASKRRAKRIETLQREALVLDMSNNGFSVEEIAAVCGITVRSVYRILRRVEEAKQQDAAASYFDRTLENFNMLIRANMNAARRGDVKAGRLYLAAVQARAEFLGLTKQRDSEMIVRIIRENDDDDDDGTNVPENPSDDDNVVGGG